jgi:flagellin-specific chaperone FliS
VIKIDLDNDKQVDYICDYFKNEALENKIEEKDKEIERLNNIINELEKWLEESIEKHTDDYIDWKYDRNVYLAGSKKLQNVFDKLQELKGSDKE